MSLGAHHRLDWTGRDRSLCFILSVLAGLMIFLLSAWSIPYVVWWDFDNLYFQADSTLVFTNLTEFSSNHYRTGMHPGFSILMLPLVKAIEAVTGVSDATAVRLLMAFNAGLQTALVYVLLRRVPLTALPATCFVVLHATCATTLVWHSLPETFAFGGTSLLVVLWIASGPRPGDGALVFANIVAMSMTLTNWMAAFYATAWHRWSRWRAILRIFVVAGLLILAIGVISKLVLPSSGYVGDFRRYLAWVRLPYPTDWQAFFGHSIVMPEPVARPNRFGAMEIVVEPAAFGSGSLVGPIALVTWFVLLSAGVVGLWRSRHRALSGILGLTTLSQFGLHSLFAEGPFLFAAHFAPLLILIAAHVGVLARRRLPLSLSVATVALLVAINNVLTFDAMVARLDAELLPWLRANAVSITEPDPT